VFPDEVPYSIAAPWGNSGTDASVTDGNPPGQDRSTVTAQGPSNNLRGRMNRLNYLDSSDASVVKAYRAAAMARYIAGCAVIGCILLASALSGCQPASGNSAISTDVGQSAPPQAIDTSLDNQLRVDPSEIMFYSSNVHG
jgi:hypothetical protein